MFGLMKRTTHNDAIKAIESKLANAGKGVRYRDNIIKSKNNALNERDATINKYRADNKRLMERIYKLQSSLKTEKKRSASYKGHLKRVTLSVH